MTQEMINLLILLYSVYVFIVGFMAGVALFETWYWKDIYRKCKRAKEKDVTWEWIKNEKVIERNYDEN